MTQQAVEQALGKLLTDQAFRERFFAAPEEACRQSGLTLSSVEVEALAQLSREQLDQLAASRLCLADACTRMRPVRKGLTDVWSIVENCGHARNVKKCPG